MHAHTAFAIVVTLASAALAGRRAHALDTPLESSTSTTTAAAPAPPPPAETPVATGAADRAAPGAPPETQGDLWISVTPYLWAASVDATVSNKGISQTFDVPFSEVFSDLDFAFMLHLEAGYRRLFFFGDYEYMRLSTTVNIDQPLLTSADVPKLLGSIEASDPTFGSGPFAQALLRTQGDLERAKQEVRNEVNRVSQEVQDALAQLTPPQRDLLARLANERIRPRVEDRVEDAVADAKLRFSEREQQVQNAVIAALAALNPGPELNYVEARMTLQIAEFGGGYRLVTWDLSRPSNEQTIFGGLERPLLAPSSSGLGLEFDLLLGARYYNLDYAQTIAFTPDKFGILPAVVDSDADYEWCDAIVGGRIGLMLGKEWRVWCRGDAGGFQSSNNSWCVQGGVAWAPLSWLQLSAGYRALGIQYQDDGTNGFGFDGVLQGPFLGVSFTF